MPLTSDVGVKRQSREAQEGAFGRKTPKTLFCMVLSLIQCLVLCELCLDIYVSLKHSYNKISMTFQTVFTPTNQTQIDCFLPINSLLQLKGRPLKHWEPLFQDENPQAAWGGLGYYKLKPNYGA